MKIHLKWLNNSFTEVIPYYDKDGRLHSVRIYQKGVQPYNMKFLLKYFSESALAWLKEKFPDKTT